MVAFETIRFALKVMNRFEAGRMFAAEEHTAPAKERQATMHFACTTTAVIFWAAAATSSLAAPVGSDFQCVDSYHFLLGGQPSVCACGSMCVNNAACVTDPKWDGSGSGETST